MELLVDDVKVGVAIRLSKAIMKPPPLACNSDSQCSGRQGPVSLRKKQSSPKYFPDTQRVLSLETTFLTRVGDLLLPQTETRRLQ